VFRFVTREKGKKLSHSAWIERFSMFSKKRSSTVSQNSLHGQGLISRLVRDGKWREMSKKRLP
jgi:hypothetical protein